MAAGVLPAPAPLRRERRLPSCNFLSVMKPT